MNTVTLQFRTSAFALLIAALLTILMIDQRSRKQKQAARQSGATPAQAFNPTKPAPTPEPTGDKPPFRPTPRTTIIDRDPPVRKTNAQGRRTAEQIIADVQKVGRDHYERRVQEAGLNGHL